MDRKEKKLFSQAYDKLYDLNSHMSNSYSDMLDELENDLLLAGHEIKLNTKTDKFKVVKKNEN